MSTSRNDGDGWRDLFVLAGTLFFGSFFVVLVAAVAGASGRAELTLESVFGALSLGLGYALIATISGLIPLTVYSFVYTFCVMHYRITYLGVTALAAGVMMLFEMVFQVASSNYRSFSFGLTVLGGLHALPTALVAHFIIKRRHRRRLRTSTVKTNEASSH